MNTLEKDEEKLGEVRRIPIQRVIPQEGQPRKKINQRKVEELAASIVAIGQQVPGIVYAIGNDLYELVDGHRRRAACMFGHVSFFIAYVREKPPKNKYVSSVVANLGREDYTVLEYLDIVRRLRDEENYTLAQIGEVCSKSSSWVTQMLSLLKLHPDVLALLDEDLPEAKQISVGVALSLVDSPRHSQPMLAKSIARLGLSQVSARNMIQDARVRSGHALQNRPDREFSSLEGMVRRSSTAFEIINKKPQDVLRELIRYGKPASRDELLKYFATIRNSLDKAEERVRGIVEDLKQSGL